MLNLKSIYNAPNTTRRQISNYRLLFMMLLISSNCLSTLPLLAASPPPGTVIENQATGSFSDPTDSTEKAIESNVVRVEVAEVAGITITGIGTEEAPSGVSGAGSNQGNGTINPDDVVYFTYKITNVGNDPTQFFIPGAPSSITGGSLQGKIEIIEYDPDGSGATAATDLSSSPVEVPDAGISTGDANALDLPNGSIPPEGTVTIRVPVKLNSTLNNNDTVTVVMGDTGSNDNSSTTQNQIYTAGTNDVYTQDNPDGTTGETDDNPLNGDATNHRQEASYRQEVTVTVTTSPSLPPQACPTGLGGFAQWVGNASTTNKTGTGSFTASGSNLPALSNFNYAVTGDVGNSNTVIIDSSETFDGANQFEPIYGQADTQSNLNVRSPSNTGGVGSTIDRTTLTTITFDETTPASGWAFLLLDIDDDQATIMAKDANGNAVPDATIRSWFVEIFDANTSSNGSNNLAVWDSANVTAVGAGTSGVETKTDIVRSPNYIVEAPAIWFQPNIPLSELSIQFESVTTNDASYHIYLASCAVTEPVASDPGLQLVKRITAINPGQSNEVRFNSFVNDDGNNDGDPNNDPDNDPNWPNDDNIYLPGAISVPNVKPGDEIEYTIYFLSNGGKNADNVQICDVIPDNMSFIPDSFSRYSGIALQNSSASGATAVNLSNIVDSDAGTFYASGTALPKVTVGDPPQEQDLCQKVMDVNDTPTVVEVNVDNNDSGAIIVELDNIPRATSAGTPNNSYGFIRFRTKVK